MSDSVCKHGSTAPIELLNSLPQSQGGIARHKCAVCAYNQGVEDVLDAFIGFMDLSARESIKNKYLKKHFIKSVG